jgi:phosphoribosyl-dephospho-CoA transferase
MNDGKLSNSNPGRHTLVWIRPECRAAVAAQVTDDAMHAQVAAWLAADRPLVVARQPCGEVLSDTIAVGTIAMGLSLPPAQGKCRIALSVAAHDIARYTSPLRLADATAHAPAEWQPALAELNAAAIRIDLELRVFGSLAWQALSGLQYLTPQSDIDLLWHPLSNTQLQQGIAMLAHWEQSSGLRADGEMLFSGNSAVSWREWATLKSGDDQRVLVKRTSSAELVDARELLELLV